MKPNPNVRLKATRALIYNTRRLVAGDEFEAAPRDARLLVAIKKATAIRAPVEVPPPPPAAAAKIAAAVAPAPVAPPPFEPAPVSGEGDAAAAAADELAAARTAYRAAVGKQPFHQWTAAELREKTAAAKTEASQ